MCSTGQSCQDGVCTTAVACTDNVYTTQPTVKVDTTCASPATGSCKALITVGGLQFRDLNGNGTLDLYEDWRKNELCRAKDLVSKMTAAEKIGLMSETTYLDGTPGPISDAVKTTIVTGHVRQALIRLAGLDPAALAAYTNRVQRLVLGTQPPPKQVSPVWHVPVRFDSLHSEVVATQEPK